MSVVIGSRADMPSHFGTVEGVAPPICDELAAEHADRLAAVDVHIPPLDDSATLAQATFGLSVCLTEQSTPPTEDFNLFAAAEPSSESRSERAARIGQASTGFQQARAVLRLQQQLTAVQDLPTVEIPVYKPDENKEPTEPISSIQLDVDGMPEREKQRIDLAIQRVKEAHLTPPPTRQEILAAKVISLLSDSMHALIDTKTVRRQRSLNNFLP